MSEDVPEDVQKEIDRIDGNIEGIFTRLGELQELRDENEALRERIEELEKVVDPNPSRLQWEQMSKSQKVQKIRRNLLQYAKEDGGVAKMNYKEVKALFDGQPSDGHTYNLMEAAADAEGFKYNAPKHGNKVGEKRVLCDLGGVNADASVQSLNNGIQSEGQL